MNYYLIPFEDPQTAKDMGYDAVPKYRNLFGRASGMPSTEISIKKWLQRYYIVALGGDSDLKTLEEKQDILRLDGDTDVQKLANLGIDVSGIISTGYEQRDKAVTKWLIGEEKILNQEFKDWKKTK